jgi:hypothetical protein
MKWVFLAVVAMTMLTWWNANRCISEVEMFVSHFRERLGWLKGLLLDECRDLDKGVKQVGQDVRGLDERLSALESRFEEIETPEKRSREVSQAALDQILRG